MSPDRGKSIQGPEAVEVAEITKKFGPVTAVNNVSFSVHEGEFFGFLGPNGAGKTTLIRMLTTLLKPTSGSASVAGYDVASHPHDVRLNIGVVPQAMTSDLDLTGSENMDIYGRFYGLSRAEREERSKYLLDMVGLSARAGDLAATYSGGMRRRLEVARVLVHRPRILFLDEPTIGLDPQSRHVVWDFLRKLREEDGKITIFLTTHYMEEAETLSDRVAIMDAGNIIALGSLAELKSRLSGNDIILLRIGNPSPDIIAAARELPFVHKIAEEGILIRVYVDSGAHNLPMLMDRIRSAGGQIQSVTIHEQSLEDVFIHYTGKSIREEEAKKVSFLLGAGVPRKWGR
ncbi:MAG: ATP-binding cassette domain-containing protein [Thermodesulfovibrionales bacterium]|nr:ATP-binding cassette domain-containing protein [Thermodesulfovibrionales bacterium]